VFLLLLLFLGREEKPVRRYLEAYPILIKKLLSRFSHLLNDPCHFQKKFSLKKIPPAIQTLDFRPQTSDSKGTQILALFLNFV
jgi:hypothetical protein